MISLSKLWCHTVYIYIGIIQTHTGTSPSLFCGYNIKVVFLGCYCLCVTPYVFNKKHPNHQHTIRDHSGMRSHQHRGISCEGKYLFSILWSGAFWGKGYIYIRAFVKHYPSRAAPWGRVIDDEWRSNLDSHLRRPPHGLLTPCHLPNGENTKGWDWIDDRNSNSNKWSHSWAIRKSIKLIEKKIVDGDNGEKRPSLTEREKLTFKGWKRKTMRTQILVNEWYCIQNIKFRFVNVEN